MAKTEKKTEKKTLNTDWKRKKATKAAVEKFEADYLRSMGSEMVTDDAYDVVSTGSLNLDYALTIGGVPTGRIVEVWGPEHAGKTTLCCLMAAEFQKAFPDQKVAWVDMEQTFSPEWAEKLGVDVKALWRPPVKTAEDTADATKRFVESGLCSLVILDSIGGMIAKMEYQKEADEATVGLVAKIVTRMVKQCSPMAKSNGTTVCVVNQVRAQIGSYGPDETTAGGWALKHVTTMRLQVRRGGATPHSVTRDGKPLPVGHEMAIKIQKNKLGPYGTTANVWLHNVETDKFGPIGVDAIKETFDFSKSFGLLGTKAGGYYLFPDETEVRGEPAAVQFMRDRPDQMAILRSKVLTSLSGKVLDETDDGADDDLDFTAAMG